MRMRIPRVLIASLLLSFSVSLIALIPAKVVLPSIQAKTIIGEFKQVRGTVWNGQSGVIGFNGLRVGRFDFEMVPLSLSNLRPELVWQSTGVDHRGEGVVNVGFGSYLDIEATSLDISLAALELPIEMVGRLTLMVEHGKVEDGICEIALGEVALTGSVPSLNGGLAELTGPLSCKEGSVQAVLLGTVGSYASELTLSYNADNTINYRAKLTGVDASIVSALALVGFKVNGSILELTGRTNVY